MAKTDRSGSGQQRGLLGDMWMVIRRERKFWLIPLILVLLVVVALLVLAGSAGPLAPFLYPLL